MSLQIAAEALTSSGALVTGSGNPQGPCLPKLTELISRGHKVRHCSPSCSDCKRLTHDVEEMFNELLLFHATFFTSYFLKWKWTERGAGWFWKCCWKRPVGGCVVAAPTCYGAGRTDGTDRPASCCCAWLCAGCWGASLGVAQSHLLQTPSCWHWFLLCTAWRSIPGEKNMT